MDLPRLREKYEKEIKSELQKELNLDNVMEIPVITKIVINSGLGMAKDDSKIIEDMLEDIGMIAGQKPVVTKTKKAISNFKIKVGQDIGIKVTLRRQMMWYFMDRLISIVLPRIKDFRGISVKAFDGNGNYALGIKEHTVFPEVDSTKVSKLNGLQVVICTSAKNDEQAMALLKKLGMPFQKVN
ncbi:50S ribosomal protein L5 [Candidatus Dojkabacteria bacterium]|uniref:Large ribosomal subunit protein uL5 n=1 Tax=Candidatus Dojkabacteria bacterium TaxID=2099670 RepID=A0A955RK09_9BACT|nr:50S ribosomal protein L5 [Candidatus Dojkabacteria bacterium]